MSSPRAIVLVFLVLGACGGSSSPPGDAASAADAGVVADGAASDARLIDAAPASDAGPAEDLCADTGGAVDESLCCAATPDMTDMCSIGACGCAPANSVPTRQCRCEFPKCFDPKLGCVDR